MAPASPFRLLTLACALLAPPLATAQLASCNSTISSSVAAPSVAPGFESRVVATGLYKPRGITFDSAGNLLVVEQTAGIVALTFDDAGGSCVSERSRTVVVNDTSLNHGIALAFDGVTLYASSAEAVYSYPYNATSKHVLANGTTIVNNMTTEDHTTRTLLLSKKQNGTLVVTRGSTANIDPLAEDVANGHSEIKAFSLLNLTGTPYDFNTQGRLLGWGLRNDVGIDEEPAYGGLYSVENSADDITRLGQNVHQNNPGEKMNFLGYLNPNTSRNGTQSPNQGGNFGYPWCFAAWDPQELPDFNGVVGQQFGIGTPNATDNDTVCQNDYVAPRLTFEPHQAPLDLKFNTAGTEAWISWHGSWDRDPPSGYKVSTVQFANGEPVQPSTSTTAAYDIVSNQNSTACPTGCFRPVGLAWDRYGRLFFSSDATGEIYIITKAGGGLGNSSSIESAMPSQATGASPSGYGTGTGSGSGSGSGSASGSAATASSTSGALSVLPDLPVGLISALAIAFAALLL